MIGLVVRIRFRGFGVSVCFGIYVVSFRVFCDFILCFDFSILFLFIKFCFRYLDNVLFVVFLDFSFIVC